MIKCLLSSPGLIAGPLHSTPLQINSQSIPRLDPIDSKSSSNCSSFKMLGLAIKMKMLSPPGNQSLFQRRRELHRGRAVQPEHRDECHHQVLQDRQIRG